jgi:hypothetical protein
LNILELKNKAQNFIKQLSSDPKIIHMRELLINNSIYHIEVKNSTYLILLGYVVATLLTIIPTDLILVIILILLILQGIKLFQSIKGNENV